MPPVYPAGSYPAQVVADGAVAYWRLGETSGTTAVDVIGGNNGTISGGVTLAQAGALADGDKAMAFDGATGSNITASAAPAYGGTANFSIECWINRSGLVQGAAAKIGTTTDGAAIGIGEATFDSPGTKVVALFDGRRWIDTGVTVPLGWHHAVLVVNALGDPRIYLDGVEIYTDDIGSTPNAASVGATIGGYSTRWFAGSVDDVAIYPTALTAQQIAAHYAARTWSPAPVSLATLFPDLLDGPYRQLTLTVTGDPVRIGDSTVTVVSPAVGIELVPGRPLTLGAFDTGPLRLHRLYASGGGQLGLTGVLY